MKAQEIVKFTNLLKGWEQTSKILGLDPEEKDIIDSYYPNPLLEAVYSMRDCIIDEINDTFSEAQDQVLKVMANYSSPAGALRHQPHSMAPSRFLQHLLRASPHMGPPLDPLECSLYLAVHRDD
jgi:hypothetical protein